MTQTQVLIKPRNDLKEPSMFEVIYLNDNKTTVGFVVESLENYFEYSNTSAHEIATKIHTEGAATVAVLPFQIAEQKGVDITMDARHAGMPLQIKIQKES